MQNENTNIGVRDLRGGNWYWIDKSILYSYGKQIGTSGIVVYNILASFANHQTQKCFPTHKGIADIAGLSRRTVVRKIAQLEKLRLVQKVKVNPRKCVYLLLEPNEHASPETTTCDKRDTAHVTPGITNKNNTTRINNNVNGFKKILYSKAPKNLEEGKPKTREECLALDLSESLYDKESLGVYLYYAKRYPEQLLRTVLSEVKEMALDDQIKKSRAALFTHILQKHVQEITNNPGN